MKAITPLEALNQSGSHIPDDVIEVINKLIAANAYSANDQSIRFELKQDEIVEAIMAKRNCSRGEVFDKKWLEIEGLYRRAGWDVTYDKPGYNESYSAKFIFHWRK